MSFSIEAGGKLGREVYLNIRGMEGLTRWMADKDLPDPLPGWNGGNFEEIPYEVGFSAWLEWVQLYESGNLAETAPSSAKELHLVLKDAIHNKTHVVVT